jgi:glycosyltransferase involved in cell wall biosynthesis
MSNSGPLVSVIICTRNGSRTLRLTMAAVMSQSLDRAKYEVIVVDDASTDDSGQIAADAAARVVHRERSLGRAVARNAGLAVARGELVVFTDDDCEPESTWLEELIEPFADSHIDGVAGQTVTAATDRLEFRYLELRNPLRPLPEALLHTTSPWARLRNYLKMEVGPTREIDAGARLYNLVGANMALRRVHIDAVGGLDDSFLSSEEEQLCRSIHEQLGGATFVYQPSARVCHHYRPGFRDSLRRARLYGHGSVMVSRSRGVTPIVYPFPAGLAVGLVYAAARRRALLPAVLAAPLLCYARWLPTVKRRGWEGLLYPYMQFLQESAFLYGELQYALSRRAPGTADIVAIPRTDNPYQELLYSQLRRRGHRVHYAAELTPSKTLNLLLLPFELVWLSARGYSVLHLHWTFGFCFTGSDRLPALRRVSRGWFGFVLWAARRAGLRLVWTAHNVLPHTPVFDDDRRARRTLIGQSDLVIAHSSATIDELSSTLATPRRSVVIPLGPIEHDGLSNLAPPQVAEPRSVLFFGRVEPYKGVEDLLVAMLDLDAELRLRVAGQCADPALRRRLERAAARSSGVTLSLEYIPDVEIHRLFEEADAAVYPFRRVTTSSSVTLAQVAARAIIVPDLPAFQGLPDEAVVRYTPGIEGLRSALRMIATMSSEDLVAKGRAARRAAASVSWEEIADLTEAALDQIAGPPKAI